MHYTVDPGLYALGLPGPDSPVLVTANYKMTFDRLRSALPGRSAWITVLDTRGINVWCAAGKGTFGTEELAERVAACRLGEIVAHRKLIVPQLGAPGVAAHKVKRITGFEVVYGPVLATDLPAFLDAGLKAFGEMRRKRFTTFERLVLVPIELVAALKYAVFLIPALLLLSGLLGPGSFSANVSGPGLFAACALMLSILAGTVVSPLLLPWIPGRAFSVKGLVAGIAFCVFSVILRSFLSASNPGFMESVSWFLMFPALASFLAMNFTGSSTYTSLSGVKKEMRWAVPLQIASGAAGLLLWLASGFFS